MVRKYGVKNALTISPLIKMGPVWSHTQHILRADPEIIYWSLIVNMMFWTLYFGPMKWRKHITLNLVMLSHLMRFSEQTNKYGMIFVSFTAIDHHKKSITVGAGLLRNKNIESYYWLLKTFLKIHRKKPTLVLNDQDMTIKQVIKNVFLNSKHILCM
uniref:MULE transposase domain-containing protein n=1 Tax=Lactuca sativa TaxID=4236 RepID=A0A9R1WW38_LACSA|nr:hypothetical protein LSAT_V11C900466870 [Lactuca sativa]